MEFTAFYPDGTPIPSVKDFVDYYSRFYYYQNSVYIESQIEEILYNGIRNEEDIAKILAWKIGKIRHKESEYKKNFVFFKGWENALNNQNGIILKDPFVFKELANYIVNNIVVLENIAHMGEPQKVLDKLNTLNTKHIGSVYLITLLFFISRGKYPIYDRFAYKALSAIKSGKYPSDICEKELPPKDSKAFSQSFDSGSIYSEYIRDIEELQKILGKGYQNNRKIDQSLWTYGHIIINKQNNT